MVTSGPWAKGMNNRTADHDLPNGTRQDPGLAVRNAVNVDFSNSGKVRRRKGSTKIYDGIGIKKSFSCPSGVFLVEGLSLRIFNQDNTTTAIYNGITGDEFAFDYSNGTVYFSDGIVNLKVNGGMAVKWGMEIPRAPVLSSTAGTYGKGAYLGAVCFMDSEGVESGSSKIVSINVGNDSGIVFSGLPDTADKQVSSTRLYLSTANGKELFRVADVSLGTESYSVLAGRYDEGAILENHFISPPPPGRIIRHYGGRSYVADSNGAVYYSEPFSFDQFKLSENFLQFPEAVDVMQPTDGGIFFAHGNQTDFYAGIPEDGFSIIKKFDYGGVFGTGRDVKNSSNVAWQSQRGMVIGGPDGSCKNIQEDNVAVESAIFGATIIKEENGLRQFVAVLKQPTTSKMAAKSWIDMEIIRRNS